MSWTCGLIIYLDLRTYDKSSQLNNHRPILTVLYLMSYTTCPIVIVLHSFSSTFLSYTHCPTLLVLHFLSSTACPIIPTLLSSNPYSLLIVLHFFVPLLRVPYSRLILHPYKWYSLHVLQSLSSTLSCTSISLLLLLLLLLLDSAIWLKWIRNMYYI